MAEFPKYKKRARELRQKMTEEELVLWEKLRNRKFFNLKFQRQYPVIYEYVNNEPRYFIADFYCAEKKVILEIDGKIHDFRKQRDNKRDEILRSMNYHLLRIKNEELGNIEVVMDKIKAFIFE
jgi:very-short-patch-repair endonuclease